MRFEAETVGKSTTKSIDDLARTVVFILRMTMNGG